MAENKASFNISNLPKAEQNTILLKKEAAFLIYKFKMFKCTREDIQEAINQKDDAHKEEFRRYLNKYRELTK